MEEQMGRAYVECKYSSSNAELPHDIEAIALTADDWAVYQAATDKAEQCRMDGVDPDMDPIDMDMLYMATDGTSEQITTGVAPGSLDFVARLWLA